MISYITGALSVLLAYAMFSGSNEDGMEEEIIEDEENELMVNDFSGRLHSLYCESCRKKKRHREIRPRVFECTRCKRTTDLRIPS